MGIFDFDIEPEFLTEIRKRTAAEADPFGFTVPLPPAPVAGVPTPTPTPAVRPSEITITPEQARDEEFLETLRARGVTTVREGRGPFQGGSGIRTLQAFGIGGDILQGPFEFAGAVGKSLIQETGRALTGLGAPIVSPSGVRTAQPRPSAPGVPDVLQQSPYKSIEQFRELPVAAQLLFEIPFDPLFAFGGIRAAIIGAQAARVARVNVPLVRAAINHQVRRAGVPFNKINNITDDLLKVAQRRGMSAEAFEARAQELIERTRTTLRSERGGASRPFKEGDEFLDDIILREDAVDELNAIRQFEDELHLTDVEIAEIALFETEGLAEVAKATPKIIRPPKTAGFVGMTNETLRQLAEHEGVDPFRVDWWDGIDPVLVAQFRQEPPASGARARKADAQTALKRAKEDLTDAKQAEEITMATGTSVQGGFPGVLAPPAQQVGLVLGGGGGGPLAPLIDPATVAAQAENARLRAAGQRGMPEVVSEPTSQAQQTDITRRLTEVQTEISRLESLTGTSQQRTTRLQGLKTLEQDIIREDNAFASARGEELFDAAQGRIVPEDVQPRQTFVAEESIPPDVPPTGGAPPSSPGAPPPAGGTTPPPAGPGDVFQEAAEEGFPAIDRALERAELFKTIDDPALVGKALERVPGIKQAIDELRPANKRADDVQTAWVAEGSETAELVTQIGSSRAQIFREIGDQFGPQSLKGNPDVPVTFIGTDTDRAVNASGDITGTLFDIFQRPHLYDLTAQQRAVIVKFQTEHQSRYMRMLIDDYGARVGEFEVAPGSAFLSNVDRNESMLDAFGISESQAIAAGRGQSRGFQTAADRMKVDPEFVPVTNMIQLQAGIDAWKARSMGLQVFKQGIGGETRIELINRLHPNLVKAKEATERELRNLKARLTTANRQADQVTRATKFNDTKSSQIADRAAPMLERLEELGDEWGPELSTLSGQVRELHRQARELESKGINLADRGLAVEGRKATLLTELGRLAPQLERLRGQYQRANLGKHQLVTASGIWRYFEPKVAQDINRLRTAEGNNFFRFLDEIRQTAFSADASPIIGVQGFLNAIANPALITKRLIGAGRSSIEARDFFRAFRQDTMNEAIAQNPQLYRDFSFWTGIPIGTVTEEFGAGFIGKIPLWGIGSKFHRFNESMFTLIQRQSVAAWEQNVQVLLKHGDSLDAAQMVAADLQHKVVPIWSSRRLGLTPSQAQARRAAVTSVSFITKPTELMATAANGFVKLGLKQTLSSQELLATRVALSMTKSLLILSIGSTVASALILGRDPWEAVKKTVDPTSGKFLCLTIGTRCIPMGGPLRAMFKAIVPRPITEDGFPVPFGGSFTFIKNRITPAVQGQIELLRDRDFQGGEIFPGDKGLILENIWRALAYEFESMAPLITGELVGGLRRGESPAEIGEQVGGQVAGVNILNESPFQFRDAEVQKFAKDSGLTQFDGGSIKNFFDMEPRHQDQFKKANPAIFAEIRAEIENRAARNIEGFPERLRAIEVREESQEQQLADDQLLQLTLAGQDGGISPLEWRDKRKQRAQDLSAQRKELFHDLDLDDPETPLDFYYEKLEEIQTDYNGVMTDAAWDELDQWQAEQTPEDQRYVDENTGLGAITPLVQEWRDDLEVLKPYFEVYENQIKPAISQGDAFIYELWLKGSPTVRNDLTQLNPQTAPIITAVNRVVNAAKQVMIFNQPEITKRLVKWEYSVDLIKRIIAANVP